MDPQIAIQADRSPSGAAETPDPGFLRLEGLGKEYGGRAAVNDLNISVAKGELVTFLGPSGCGKTTTLRMIAGFIQNDSGAIYIDGRRVDTLSTRLRGTAMVFQDYALFPHMTIFNNVAFGLRMRKVSKDEIARRVREVLDTVQLKNVEDKYPKELSGGMRQRVALARAIVVEPRVLLLDEPLSNLDAKLRKNVRRELREIHDRVGITTVLVTHDLEEAFSLGDRVVVMNDGKVEQHATPAEIYSQPANPFVADFVGHTNLIHGEWTARAEGGGVFTGGGLTVTTKTSPTTTGTQPAVYTVPPNNVRISVAEEKPVADNVVRGVIRDLAFLGALYSVRVEVGNILLDTNVVTGSLDRSQLADGREIWVYWDANEGYCVAS